MEGWKLYPMDLNLSTSNPSQDFNKSVDPHLIWNHFGSVELGSACIYQHFVDLQIEPRHNWFRVTSEPNEDKQASLVQHSTHYAILAVLNINLRIKKNPLRSFKKIRNISEQKKITACINSFFMTCSSWTKMTNSKEIWSRISWIILLCLAFNRKKD